MLLKGDFSKDSFWTKGLIVLLLSIFGLLLWLGIVSVLQLNESAIQSIFLTQLIFGLVGLAFPAFVGAYLLHEEPTTYLHIKNFPNRIPIVLTLLSIVLLIPFINSITLWNEQLQFPKSLSTLEDIFRNMQKMADDLTLRLLSGNTIAALFSNLFFLALVPAITEELFFRGLLQKLLSEKIGKHLGIWAVAIIFSAYHMQFFGFVPRMMLGAMLGYLLLWSNSLYIPIIAHFTNNALLVLFYFLYTKKEISVDINTVGTTNQWWIAFFSAIFGGIILFLIYHYYKQKKKMHFLST